VTLPWAKIANVVRQRIVIDGRNALDPDVLLEAGFVYSSFGRGHRIPAELEVPAMRAPAHEGMRLGIPIGAELAIGDL
jgi:hypothetical protein